MFALQMFTSILSFLSLSVQAFPLSQREVVAPPILKPDASSVWPIGTQQIVIWDTSAIPPPSQVTNPTGKIILGFNESNSLNLNLDNPLAQNFSLTDGSVTVTVPDVPPRNDYIIVLFGDSGDASPSFAITSISSGMSVSSSSASSSSVASSSALASSLSVTGSVTTPASTGSTSNTAADGTTASPPTGTTTSSTGPSSSSSSNNTSSVTSASAASSSTSSGWSLHRTSSTWSSAVPFLMGMAPLVMAFMV